MCIVLAEQITVCQFERKQEVAQWFIDIVEAYNKCSIEYNIIGSELITYMACSLVDMIYRVVQETSGALQKP